MVYISGGYISIEINLDTEVTRTQADFHPLGDFLFPGVCHRWYRF